MANGPMGGFMPTPPAPAQPPQVKLDTTASSRGNFNTFLKNMNGAMNPPLAPMVGAAAPTLAPTMSDIDIFNPPMQMMQQGGNVAPRQTEIMGQPHMLAYITPQEGQLLEGLGGANKPGPMGIPSFFVDDFGDFSSVGDDAPSVDDGGSFSDDAQATDPGVGSDDNEQSFVDDDPVAGFDFDPVTGSFDVVSTPTVTQDEQQQNIQDSQSFIDAANAEAAAQAAANQVQQSLLAQQNQQTINQAIANQQKAKDDLIDAQIDLAKSGASSTTQPSLPSAMTGIGGTTGAANIAAASGVGLGKDPERDRSDFSLDLDALANLRDQATKGSFPSLDNIPGTFGAITSIINQATKTGAQNTLKDIEKGFAPTYGKDGQITGTTNFGIGMGVPGGIFGSGTSVSGYQPFDDTSPTKGMYDDNQDIGGDDSDPLILKKPKVKKDDEDDKPTILPPLGIGDPRPDTEPLPTVVKSPFDPSTTTFTPVGFDSGDLNKLIEQITGIPAPRGVFGGPVPMQDGGLIRAVDDFLATGT